MTSLKSWLRCLLVVCICCTAGVQAEEIDTSDIHRSSAVYGDASRTDHVLQTLDIYQKRSDIRANPQRTKPVVIYIHGGGWFFGDKADVYAKPASFLSHDMLFVSANCRLQAEYTLLDQLEAGGHLVSLIATDPRYLKQVGLSPSNLKGVVAINSNAYDVAHRMANSKDYLEQRRIRLTFGEPEKVWTTVSPISHVGVLGRETTLPAFALLHVAEDEVQAEQARRFARQLQDARSEVLIIPANSKTRDTIDQELGIREDTTSLALMAFLRAKL